VMKQISEGEPGVRWAMMGDPSSRLPEAPCKSSYDPLSIGPGLSNGGMNCQAVRETDSEPTARHIVRQSL
jgi:hypothetical protein